MSGTDAKRVLYVHRTRGHGVEGIHIRGIVDGLKTRGYQVDMIGPLPATTSGHDAGAGKSFIGKVFAWLSEHAPEFVFELAELAYNVVAARQMMRHKSDIAFVYERYAIFALAGAWFARQRRIPLVLEINYTSCSPLVRTRTAWLKPLARCVDGYVFRRAAVLVAVSSTLKRQLIHDYGVDAARIVLSPNAADPAKFDPAITPIESAGDIPLTGKRVIGFVGSFAPWHGVDLLVKAFAEVTQIIPEAALMLIGDGPERANIEALAAKLGVRERVIFTGPVPHAQLAGYVARFHAAVMPDSNDYGSPMKIFEYLAMARPVVAPDYPPIRDVLRHDENGLIFKAGDARALAAQLTDVCRDNIKAARLGAAGRRTVCEERTWLHNVDMFLAALRATAPTVLNSRVPASS